MKSGCSPHTLPFAVFPIVALLAAPAVAQEDEGVLEGHSIHGEAFNEGPRQAAYLMPNPGNVHFEVTSSHPDVQAMFNQGIGQLHGFWYFEAERTFRQIAAWDPDCAMAYWGMAVANFENFERGAAFAQEAYDRRANASERERMYVDAWARFYGVEMTHEDEDADEDATPADGHGSGSGQGNGKGPGPGGGGGKGARTESDEGDADVVAEEAPDDAAPGDAATELEDCGDATDGAGEAVEDTPVDEASGTNEDAEPELTDEEEYERNKKALKQLVLDIEEIIRAYPDDIEAKAFLVVHMWYGRYVGLEMGSQQALQSMLDEVFRVTPNHPAHHYRIHLWDKEETSEYVVDSAVASGPSWPNIAHMWHMGGHIFENLGRHRDAAWQQDASARIDHAHMMSHLVLPDQIHNYAHNNEWLIRSLAHCGRIEEALDLARNMIELPRHPTWNMPDMGGTSAFWGRRRLAGVCQEFELWDELVALADTNYLARLEHTDEDGERLDDGGDAAHRAFVLGEAHTHLGNETERLAEIAELRNLLTEAKLARAEALDSAEEEAIASDKKRDGIREAMHGALDEHREPVQDLRDKIAILEALADVLNGTSEDLEASLKILEDTGYERTALSRLYLDAELHEKAEELARDAAKDKPGQALVHANLAYVLEGVGKRDEALEAFRELREFSAEFDLALPAFTRLAPLREAEGLEWDGRVDLVIPDDVGARGDLDQLGPRRWSPPPAPEWSAEDELGVTHTMADGEPRPRILILFLGFGCAHCVEQLQAFGPAADDFAAAGIDLVAIGDDGWEELNEYDLAEYPFPILADPEYDVFREYRCYDDFEDAPLHGTFLIDAEDRIRWHDISFEPFTDTDFLLGESQRLLGLPTL